MNEVHYAPKAKTKDSGFYYVTIPAGTQFSTVRRIPQKPRDNENSISTLFGRVIS